MLQAANPTKLEKIPELEGRVVRLIEAIEVRGTETAWVLAPAGSLFDVDSISIEDCFEVARQITSTLGILQEHGLLHGDISY